MGPERRSHVMEEKVKLATAYHEVRTQRDQRQLSTPFQGGHALSAIYTKGAMPLYKVTCMPRGHALGVVSVCLITLEIIHQYSKDTCGAGRRSNKCDIHRVLGRNGRCNMRKGSRGTKYIFVFLYNLFDINLWLVYGKDSVTSGASTDLVAATRIARNMVRVRFICLITLRLF